MHISEVEEGMNEANSSNNDNVDNSNNSGIPTSIAVSIQRKEQQEQEGGATRSCPDDRGAERFLPIQGEENYNGRPPLDSCNGNSNSDNKADNEDPCDQSQSSSSTDRNNTNNKSRRIEYLTTAHGGLEASNKKLSKENESLRQIIKSIKAVQEIEAANKLSI